MLWIWYPADAGSCGAPADFLPRPWTPIADQLGVDVTGVHTHAVADAPAADRRSPVLLLSPSGFSPLFLGSIAEELASHGYVVVGVNHTFETAVTVFRDGRVATINPAALGGALGPQIGPHDAASVAPRSANKSSDLRFVADNLTGSPQPCRAHRGTPPTAGRRVRTLLCGNAALDGAAQTNDAEPRPIEPRLDRGRRSACPARPPSPGPPEFALNGQTCGGRDLTDQAARSERMLPRDGGALDRLASPVPARIAGSTHMSLGIPFLRAARQPVAHACRNTSDRGVCDHQCLLLGFFAEQLDGFSDPVDGFPAPTNRGLLGPQ